VAYGPGDRHRIDLFLPAGAAQGTVMFIHGGYWMAFDRRDWSHLAAGALARGWAVAMPSYDLCPEVRIADITGQMRRALAVVAPRGPVVVTGHSAGGHLAARLAGALGVVRAVPISPLSNLAPLMATDMNATLRIDVAEAAGESPVLHPRPATPVHVWVGGDERPAFLDQARWLAQAWTAPLTVDPGRHHFDVIDGLTDADSPLMAALLDGL
jgi:acetyl esterase/lipase